MKKCACEPQKNKKQKENRFNHVLCQCNTKHKKLTPQKMKR